MRANEMNRCERNDALTACYSDFSPELRAHLAWRLPRSQNIEDLLQEIFLRACQAFGVRHVEHPRAYIYQVANSVICDHFRKAHRRNAPSFEMEEFDETQMSSHATPTPEELAIGEELWEDLCRRIERLPKKVREAILLRKVEDLSYSQVADSMGISVRTVEKHLARALNDLRADVDAVGD